MTPPIPNEYVTLGSIIVHDKDRNGAFDPKVDEIKSSTGAPLRPDSQQVKKALFDLGMTSFKGLNLSKAGMFARLLTDADYYSKFGEPEKVRASLLVLVALSADMKVAYPKDRADKLLKQAYEKGLPEAIRSAKFYSDRGDLNKTYSCLENALSYSDVLEKDYGVKRSFDHTDAEKILDEAYPRAVENSLKEVENSLESIGWDPAPRALKTLEEAEDTALEGGVPFDYDRADELKAKALEKGIDYQLGRAEDNLSNRKIMKNALSQVRKYEEEGGEVDSERRDVLSRYLDVDEELRYLQDTAYMPGSPLRFERMKDLKYAKDDLVDYIQARGALRKAVAQGQVEKLEDLFVEAEDRAQRLKKYDDIDVGFSADSWSEMRETALANRVEKDFKQVEVFAAQGEVDLTETALADLWAFADHWGVDLDPDRSDAARNKARTERLERTYTVASLSAFFGDKKACEKALKDAEIFSKDLGVPFDKKRAETIKKSVAKHPPHFPFGLGLSTALSGAGSMALKGAASAGVSGVFSIPNFPPFPGLPLHGVP